VRVTGDHPLTAGAIAGQIGLGHGSPRVLSLDGRQDQELDADELAAADVIARAAPGQKLLLVQALQARGPTVAVSGDGVYYVPAQLIAHYRNPIVHLCPSTATADIDCLLHDVT